MRQVLLLSLAASVVFAQGRGARNAPPTSDRPAVLRVPERTASPTHFVAVATAGRSLGLPETNTGGVSVFDRDTWRLIGETALPGNPTAMVSSADGTSLYIAAGSGIAVVNTATVTVRTVIPLRAQALSLVYAVGEKGTDRLLSADSLDNLITVIDPATDSTIGTVSCPATPDALRYNSFNGMTYGLMPGRAELCAIGPDFQPAPPLPLPIGKNQTLDNLLVLDNGSEGLLLITTADVSRYYSVALDLRDGSSKAFSVPALDDAYPLSAPALASPAFYAMAPDRKTVAYDLHFGSGGTPELSLLANTAAPGPTLADDRFAYAPVGGSCFYPEFRLAPQTAFPCVIGFAILDARTLEPAPKLGAITLPNRSVRAVATGVSTPR